MAEAGPAISPEIIEEINTLSAEVFAKYVSERSAEQYA